jgi:hypothetical protein
MIDDPEQPEWFNKIMRVQKSEIEPPVRSSELVRCPICDIRFKAGDSVKLIPSHKDNRPTTVRSAGPETVVLEEPRGGYQCWNNADIEPWRDEAPNVRTERPEAI